MAGHADELCFFIYAQEESGGSETIENFVEVYV